MSNPNWEKIRREWETSKITFKDLAEKHDVPEGTVKSRRSREKWSKDATNKKDATLNGEKMQPKKKRKKQKNRSGNPNPKNQFTERNSAALKHGFFSRYIPKETLEIMGSMNKDDPADIIWDQVMLQYAAIMRAQQIMFVEDKHEIIKELKKLKAENVIDQDGNEVQIPIEQEYEFQFSWDRQASFMNAQSRAISELRSSIRQFLEMAHDEDERRLKLEQMRINIDKSKVEISSMKSDGDDEEPIEIVIRRKGDDS